MPEDKPSSQSINISGGKMENVQIGGIAGKNQNVAQTQQANTSVASPKPEDVAALLDELEALLRASDLSEEQKNKALQYIDAAKEEAQAIEPDKDFAAKSLKKATTAMKEAGATGEAEKKFLDRALPILEAMTPWLKVAAGFFL